ncbi:unnamed protein product [Phytophthora fragariaefolia]|uniref:Unnamed protein product n=1 Tax=Phytophthora fragariaefolia TaxID=1490495 RepID=A0A9W6XVD6_9STRA|nr:unnamed protein product [Phytophthora fragariaefolia]
MGGQIQTAQHTAEYIAGEIDKVIDEIESATAARVVGVVTDNAKNMKNASSQVQSRRPNVISGGCSAHVLNLLMQDIGRFPVVKDILSRAGAVTRFVRDHLALYDEFKQLQQGLRDAGSRAKNLVLPVPTRWYSVHACLKSVLNSRDVLEKLFLSPGYMQFRDRYRGTKSNRRKLQYIMQLISDDAFWSSLRTIVRLFDPIIEALRALEADNGFVSGVYNWFRWLRYHNAHGATSPEPEPEPDEPESESEYVDSEFEDNESDSDGVQELAGIGALTDAAAMVSSPLPASQRDDRGSLQTESAYQSVTALPLDLDDLVGSHDENVDDQVGKLAVKCGLVETADDPDLTREVLSFKALKRRGGEAMRTKYSSSSPSEYWLSKSDKKYPLLRKIAHIVFVIPTSSAASERAWSIFDHIHSKRRKRLSVEKVEMLAYIYINYGTINHGEIDFARHQSCPESVEEDS